MSLRLESGLVLTNRMDITVIEWIITTLINRMDIIIAFPAWTSRDFVIPIFAFWEGCCHMNKPRLASLRARVYTEGEMQPSQLRPQMYA